ncbi:MAG: hypothetical protein K0S46_1592 [Moraxellaceae bacterium]|jgi:hypothetical protein|nr:hypothetical protein [Moraxellaceae bacterium]
MKTIITLGRGAGALLLGSTLLLAGCSDDNNTAATSSTSTISGTAATGAPIVGGTVTLACKGGATASDITSAQGRWSVTMDKSSLPCAVQVTNGTVGGIANTQTLFSFTLGSGDTITTNLTPLTTLALAKAWGSTLDVAFFAGLDDSGLATLSASIAAAVDTLVTDLQARGFTLPGGSFNPLSRPFSPESGNAYDDLLEHLKAALAAAGTDLDSLMALYADGSGNLPDAPETGAGECTSGVNKLVFGNSPSSFCGFTKSASSAGESGYYQFTSTAGDDGVTYVKLTLSGEQVLNAIIENNAYAFVCNGASACSGINGNFISGGLEVTFTNAVLSDLSGTLPDMTVNGTLTHTTSSGTGGSSEGLPATPLEGGQFGVRFAVNGVINGTEQSGQIRYWAGPFAFEDVTSSSFTAYIASDTPSDSFSLRNLPNTPGTYDCGAAFGAALGRNIEFGLVGGDGFSTMDTSGVTGFTCSITITQGRTYSTGLYYGAMEGSFQARFFKTGQAVNLGDSVFVSGNFRLGDTSVPPFIPPVFIVPLP